MPERINPPVPHITVPVVEYLDTIFPDRCPDPTISEREVWMNAGSARVVRKLKHMIQVQESSARETIEGA
jgi:hypothetical protein